MEIKSYSINDHYFCVWQEDFGYTMEGLTIGHRATFCPKSMLWLEEEFTKILKEPINGFLSKEIRMEQGFVHLAKFRTMKGWCVEIAWWPSSGGRRNLHIPVGFNKKEWYSFTKMLSVSMRISKQQSHQILRMTICKVWRLRLHSDRMLEWLWRRRQHIHRYLTTDLLCGLERKRKKK